MESVAEFHRHSNELLIDINDESLEPPSGSCIYRVPEQLREINAIEYTPQVVSIGPFHHGNPKLAFMEKQKKRYARRFGKKIGLKKWKLLERFVKDNKENISDCYDDTLELKSPEFEKMVMLDAIFIVEYMLGEFFQDQNDFLIYRTCMNIWISRDFMLLENQLPYVVLERVYTLAFGDLIKHKKYPSFLSLCEVFFYHVCEYLEFEILDESELPAVWCIYHFTDLLRTACLDPSQIPIHSLRGFFGNIPSASKLNESGLKFKCIIKGSNSMTNMKFMKRKPLVPLYENNELHMPTLSVKDTTECFLRNVMALEQCHYPKQDHICNFILFLDKLIETKEDVEVLIENGILENYLVGHNALIEMIKNLTKNICVGDSFFYETALNLQRHYRNPWNNAKATLVNLYFNNPWRGTATIAAGVLLILTLIQTICSILQVIYA